MDFSENSSQIVEIKTSDMAFKVSGCGTWELAEEADTFVYSDKVIGLVLYSIVSGIMNTVELAPQTIEKIEDSAYERATFITGEMEFSERDEGDVLILLHFFNKTMREWDE